MLLLQKKGALNELTDAKAKEIRLMLARRIRKAMLKNKKTQ